MGVYGFVWGGAWKGEGERERGRDDGLHFTERRYGIVGERTGRFILGLLEGPRGRERGVGVGRVL